MNEDVKIYFVKSSAISISHQQPSVKLVDALSTVGGVWGLWIGLSVSVLMSIGIDTLNHFYEPTSAVSLHKMPKTFITHYEGPQSTMNHMNENKPKSNKAKSPETTSISSQINNISLIHDMLWWTGVVTITLVYIWQTYLTINEYLQFKVIQTVTTELQDNSSFPTVYACSDTDLFYTAERLQNNTELSKKVYYLQELLEKKIIFENGRFYRENFTDSERLSLLPSVGDFITSCEFYSDTGNYIPCRFQEKKFLGVAWLAFVPHICVIISPVFPQIENTIIKNLVLKLKYPQNVATFSRIETRIGFDPFSMLDKFDTSMPLPTHDVTPGNHLIFKYSMTETNRLPYPYTSKCIPSNTTYTVWPDYLKEFSANFTYSYTFKACLHLCLLSPIIKNKCNGSSDTSKCQTDLKVCGCQYPCKSVDYNFKISEATNVYKQKIALGHYSSISELKNYMWSGISVVNVERESAYKTVKAEKPAVQPDSLVGIIGGISGLWIGQSILNFFVEFQRLITFINNKLMNTK